MTATVPHFIRARACASWLCLAAALPPLAGCSVGPDYRRPGTPLPLAYKELPAPPPGWALARPQDGLGGGNWWTLFHDPVLDALERRVAVDNQNIRAAEAAYRQAQALIAQARAGLFPTLSGSGGLTRTHSNNFTASNGSASLNAGWDIDLWGKIRRSVEGYKAQAQASAADLANATLSAQASLATLYFELSYQDALKQLLQQTVQAYQRALTITTNQARFGIVAQSDVITAQTQLDSAQSQLIGADVLRTQYQHAIADLIGVPPVDLDLSERTLPAAPPQIPVSLPATLLQRRPDVAAAERLMQQANANIGVAVAAYYPDISLSAFFEYAGSPLSMLFNASRQAWSIGATLTQDIFEGGLRDAQVASARASYDQSVAQYRQTVLDALQQVEDQLSALRILARQAEVQDRANQDAQRAVAIALNQYQAGTQSYTTVVQAQTILLGDQTTALQIAQSRMVAAVTLIQALGGDWSRADLPRHPG